MQFEQQDLQQSFAKRSDTIDYAAFMNKTTKASENNLVPTCSYTSELFHKASECLFQKHQREPKYSLANSWSTEVL